MGKRKLFHGTMNASKSAQLLMQVYNLERQGKTFVIFKPTVDTRDKNIVKSRALPEKRAAIPIQSDDIDVMYRVVQNGNYDFIFVDEFNFFTGKQVEELAQISIDFNKPIFAYGLTISYTGKIFESTKKAIECGFTLHELKMQCDYCESKATHHLLYVNDELMSDGHEVFIGNEEFRSVCYPCYLNAHKSKK